MLFQVFIVPTRRLMWATYGLFLVVLFFTIAAGCSPADLDPNLPPRPPIVKVDAGVDSMPQQQPDASPQPMPDAMVAVDSLPPDSQVVPDASMPTPDASPQVDSMPPQTCFGAPEQYPYYGFCSYCRAGNIVISPTNQNDAMAACSICSGSPCQTCQFYGDNAVSAQTQWVYGQIQPACVGRVYVYSSGAWAGTIWQTSSTSPNKMGLWAQ